YARGERAGDRNLNRNLFPRDAPADFEDRIANRLCPLLAQHDVLLDLHSTRAATQPFCMLGPRDNQGEVEPFAHAGRERALALTLECGQHEDPASPEVAYRAIRNALAHLRLVDAPAPAAVERYEGLRIEE